MVEPEQVPVDYMAHVHCMLDNKGYRRTIRICTTYCFSTETMVTTNALYFCVYTTLHVLIDSTAGYRSLFDATGSIFICKEKSVFEYILHNTRNKAARLRFGR